ncbi:T9SS type A sorting domain-containing protein [Cryomorpha ignava]|uniref:T9SS type A sorting domain-containing protein n=1 Tax=Cryomorpha ignava TaxID=101383 RepID=A0A7K3WT56_9FLAO|nr:T9SS type A sorting domain-containing protein [Cryomorpha ignava]NEN24674.1 T9SS type A sorting domain-containing protein [Cryomorpha ignava]
MPSFSWGSGNQFPLAINFKRGPLGSGVGLERIKEAEFSIFPNPATSHILMSFTNSVNANFRIYNANGMLVKSGAVIGEQQKINLDGFAAGLYFVEIQDEKGSLVKKFVVDR